MVRDLRLGLIGVNFTGAKTRAGQLRSDKLRPIANAFVSNAHSVKGLLGASQYPPINSAIYLTVAYHFHELASSGKMERLTDKEKVLAEVFEVLRAVCDEHASDIKSEYLKNRNWMLDSIGQDRDYWFWLIPVLSSATLLAWTTLECVAKDACLAARKTTRKHDFTSLPEIKKAYFAEFGKVRPLQDSFENEDLKALAAIRHVIVHRAAVVDAQFRQEIKSFQKRAGITFELGQLVPFDGKMVSILADAALDAGCKLLEFVDEWLQKHPA